MAKKRSVRGAGSKKSYRRDAFEGETDETTIYVEPEKSVFNVITPFKHNSKQKLIIEKMLHDDTKILILDGLWGSSKAQPLDAKILTSNGWKLMGDIHPGDTVIGSDGKSCNVLNIFPQGKKEIYKVTFSDGSSTECCMDHLWATQTERERNRHSRKRNNGSPIYTKCPLPPKVRTLHEIKDTLLTKRNLVNHSIPMVEPIDFNNVDHVIDPYILGILIGDGGLTRNVRFTSADKEIADKVESLLPSTLQMSNTAIIEYGIIRRTKTLKHNPFKLELERLHLMGKKSNDKFIPNEYLFDSLANRINLLNGLMDSDGTTNGYYTSYTTTSKILADNVQFLVESLGGTGIITEFHNCTYINKRNEKRHCLDHYKVSVKLPNNIPPFSLTRKKEKLKPRKKYLPIRYITSITFVAEKNSQCILVDSDNHLYITDHCIVTHNTYCSVYSALKLLARGQIEKIYYVRTPCESSNTAKIGTLPGSLQERLAGYNAVMEEKLVEFIPFNIATKLIKDGVVEYLPPGLIRGRNLTDAVLICDEASNFSWEDILLICSRLGTNSRLYMIGDSFQNDIGKKSGFKKFYDIMNTEKSVEQGIHCHQMRDKSDIVRSGIIRYIMETVGVI